MAEYIEREALRNSVESIDWYSVYKGKLTAGAPNTENALYKANSIYAVIDNAPDADVAPVVHGEWIKYPRARYFKCSECRCIVPYKKAMVMDGERKYKYCPNCGAKMDGGNGNSDMA